MHLRLAQGSLLLALTAATGFVACLDVSTGTGSGSGADAAAAATTTSTDGATAIATASSVTGVDCASDTNLNVSLCLSTSKCPNVVVDQSVFPGCGWRVANGVADLQCDCNGMMCPIGTPTSCAQAVDLLGSQTQGTVCQGLSEGRCTTGASGASGSGSSGSGGGSGCDQACAANCVGSASCLQSCGC